MKKLLFILILSCVCFADDWPYFLGQDLNGISNETQISKNWKQKQPKKLWEVKIGDGYSGITVVGDLVYTAYGTNREEYCVAVNDNGKVAWSKVIGPYFYSRIGSGPRATPTIHEGRLYIVGAYGDFHCLEAKTGKTLWNFNILRKFKTKNLKWGMCSSPVIYKNMLLYNVGGNNGNSIVALDQKTGETLWQSGNDPASYATPTIAKICGEDQAIFFTGNGLYTVDPNNGKHLWSFSWPVFKNAATPICQGDYVFLSSSYGAGAGALLHVQKNGDKYNVKQIWKNRRFKNHYTTSILWKNHLYGFHNNIFTCVNFKNGENTWVQRGFKKGLLIATNDGHAIVLGQAGNLALVKLDSQKYIELGNYQPFGKTTNCLVIPTLANGKLYVRDNERLICLDISNQQLPLSKTNFGKGNIDLRGFMNSKQQLIARVIFQQKWMTEAQIRNAYANFQRQNLSISFLDFLEKKQFISPMQKAQVVKIITSSLHQTRPHKFCIKENQRFLQYHIEREIGHGGMGVVYKAKDLKLQRDVAIKVLSNTNRDSVQLFIQEARTIAQLNHPYVIKIYDVGETPLSYFAMEYIDGYTLEDYMYSHKISFDKWAIFFHKMAQALDFIHQKEIIHRDIKPANIMIDKDGEPRLMDFGLAKTHEDKSLPSGFVGTPSYASPEQIESNSVSFHSDIYSLGATLYEVLTNTKIFQGEMVHLVYQIVKSDPVHPKTLNPSIPVDLQAICLKCIAKKPLQRYKTAAHLANDLDNFIHNRPVTAKSPSYLDITKKWIARNMLLSCFIFLFLVSIHTALAIIIYTKNNLSTAYEKLKIQQQKTQEQKYKMQLQLYRASLNKIEDFVQYNSFSALTKTLDHYSQQNFLLNKSQNYLQLSTELNPSKKLEIRLLNNLFHKPQNLVSNHFYYSNFSVNKTNTFAATNYGQELRIIDLQNAKQKKYVVKERISCTAFHPYKQELFVGGAHGVVFKIDLTTGQQTQLDIYPQLQSWITFGRFSANGSQIVYCIVNSRGESSLVVLDWQTHEYKVVTPKLTARADGGISINMEQIINIACTKNNRILMLTGKKNAGLGIFYFVGNTTVKLFETEKIITDIALHNNTIVISYLSGELVFGKINDQGAKITYRQTNKQSQAHQGAILSISATSDHIVSCGKDNVIKIWGYDGKLQHTFSHTNFIKAHFIPKSNRLMTMNFYKHIQLWSLTRKSPIVLRGAKKWANLAISPQSRYLALTIKTSISLIEIWDLQKRKPIKILPDGVGKLDFRQMNSIFVNENQLLTRGEKIVRYWNIHKANNFQQVLRYKNQNYTHQDNVQAMNCAKNYIITTDNQKLCLWNKKSKHLEKEWDSLFENICFADFYAENTLIVGSMIKDGSLQFEFINTHNGNVHRTPLTVTDDEGKETPFYNTVKQHAILHFHNKKYLFLISKFAKQDASLIYMFTCDHTLKKQTLCATFTGHSGNINKIAFTNDSSRMVSAGHDHSIKIWDLENIKKHPVANECLLSIKEHTAPVTGVVFNKDCSELISVSEDQTIRIWSLKH